MSTHAEVLFALLLGHAVADYPLQTDYIARFKNWNNASPPPPGQKQQAVWPYVMSAHAATHSAAVWIVTSSLTLAACEFVAHWLIDAAKCAGRTDIHTDQALHVVCKVLWLALYVGGIR